jgi:hypothetical protein
MLQRHLPPEFLSKPDLTTAETKKQPIKKKPSTAKKSLPWRRRPEGDDQVNWNRKALGLQSRSFLLSGAPKGLGSQSVTDADAATKGTAFAKVLSFWTVKNYSQSLRDTERKEADDHVRVARRRKKWRRMANALPWRPR